MLLIRHHLEVEYFKQDTNLWTVWEILGSKLMFTNEQASLQSLFPIAYFLTWIGSEI
jgi:hypothetical protein